MDLPAAKSPLGPSATRLPRQGCVFLGPGQPSSKPCASCSPLRAGVIPRGRGRTCSPLGHICHLVPRAGPPVCPCVAVALVITALSSPLEPLSPQGSSMGSPCIKSKMHPGHPSTPPSLSPGLKAKRLHSLQAHKLPTARHVSSDLSQSQNIFGYRLPFRLFIKLPDMGVLAMKSRKFLSELKEIENVREMI